MDEVITRERRLLWEIERKETLHHCFGCQVRMTLHAKLWRFCTYLSISFFFVIHFHNWYALQSRPKQKLQSSNPHTYYGIIMSLPLFILTISLTTSRVKNGFALLIKWQHSHSLKLNFFPPNYFKITFSFYKNKNLTIFIMYFDEFGLF